MIEYDFTKPFDEQSEAIKGVLQELWDNRDNYDPIVEEQVCLSGFKRPVSVSFNFENLVLRETINYINEPSHPAFMSRRNSVFYVIEGGSNNIQTLDL